MPGIQNIQRDISFFNICRRLFFFFGIVYICCKLFFFFAFIIMLLSSAILPVNNTYFLYPPSFDNFEHF